MRSHPEIPPPIPSKPDVRLRRLIALTASLVSKMLDAPIENAYPHRGDPNE